jgi:response regulator NasT
MLKRGGILVVEDEPIIRLALVATLEAAGLNVIGEAGTRRAALTIAERSPPEVAVLDINLYGIWDGFVIARDLVTRYGTKIVFMTSYQENEVLERARACRPVAIVNKPASDREIVRAVSLALRRSQDTSGKAERSGLDYDIDSQAADPQPA